MTRALLLTAVCTGLILGQSFFNTRGLGEIVDVPDARSAALGSTYALSPGNPGVFVQLAQTRIAASGIASAALGAETGVRRFVGTVRPGAVRAAVPLPAGLRVLAGIDSRFGQDFDVWSDSLADTAYRRHVIGRGGVYDLRAGVAWTLLDRLCFGATFDHLMGGAREYWEFASGGGDYSVTDTIEVNYSANTFQLGTSVQFARFSLAAMYEPALTMNAHRFLRIHGVVGDSERQYRISLPRTLRFGAGVSPVAGLGLSAGIDLLPWSGATIDARTAGFRDVARLSAGLEYEITPGHPLRLGYSHQRWYFDAASIVDPGFGTIPIAEQGLHAGTSIPVPKFGTLDLAASVLLRAAGDLRETAGRLSVTLAYGESWTRRTRRWGY